MPALSPDNLAFTISTRDTPESIVNGQWLRIEQADTHGRKSDISSKIDPNWHLSEEERDETLSQSMGLSKNLS